MKRGHRHIVVLLLVFWVWFTACAVYELGWDQARLQWPIAIVVNLVDQVLWYVLVFSANVVNQYPQLLQISSFSQLWYVLSQIGGQGITRTKDFLTWWTWGIVAVLTGLALVGSSQKLRDFAFVIIALLITKLGLVYWQKNPLRLPPLGLVPHACFFAPEDQSPREEEVIADDMIAALQTFTDTPTLADQMEKDRVGKLFRLGQYLVAFQYAALQSALQEPKQQ